MFPELELERWLTTIAEQESYTIEKVEDPSEVHNYYYEAEIDFKDGSFLKVLRFSEAVSAYARFHNHTLREHHLE